MPSNQFLPFATGGSANVTDQTTYAGASTTANGFSSGLAKSADVNKVLRQASFVAAAVAQMIADNQSNNVNDDGNVSNFETNLIAAIRALVPGAFVYLKAGTGYIKFPGAGAPVIQWGQLTASGGVATCTYSFAFPTATLAVLATEASASAWSSSNISVYGTYSQNASGFTLKNFAWNGSAFAAGSGYAYYFAIGY
jgi:hypothetical protein